MCVWYLFDLKIAAALLHYGQRGTLLWHKPGIEVFDPWSCVIIVAFEFFPHNYNLGCWEVAEFQCKLLLSFSWPCLCVFCCGVESHLVTSIPYEPSEEGNRGKKGTWMFLPTERWRVVLFPHPQENKTRFSSWDNSSIPMVSFKICFLLMKSVSAAFPVLSISFWK